MGNLWTALRRNDDQLHRSPGARHSRADTAADAQLERDGLRRHRLLVQLCLRVRFSLCGSNRRLDRCASRAGRCRRCLERSCRGPRARPHGDRLFFRASAAGRQRVGDFSGIHQGGRRVVSAEGEGAGGRNFQRRHQHRRDPDPVAGSVDRAHLGLAMGVRRDRRARSGLASAMDSILPRRRRASREFRRSESAMDSPLRSPTDLGVHRGQVDGGSGMVVLSVLAAKVFGLEIWSKAWPARRADHCRLFDRRRRLCGRSVSAISAPSASSSPAI